MIFQSGRVAVRLPQLRLQCLGGHRATPSSLERVAALHNVLQAHNISYLPFKTSFITPIAARRYAGRPAGRPASRPKAHTGRTTTAARKAPTTSKTTAAKKPAPKKTAPKAKPKAKSKAKPRIKPKPKPAKQAKAKPKKILTEVQKQATVIKDLRATALASPHGVPYTAWTVFSAEYIRQHKGSNKLGPIMKEASAQYKQITPEQLEHYNHLANQNKVANAKAYRQWIESHTPLAIHEANNARQNLNRRGVKTKFPKLQDHRQVTGARGPYIYFSKERFESGDFKGLKLAEAAKLAGREYQALSASEKKPYEDAAKQDMMRYEQEVKTVYNKSVDHSRKPALAA